MYKKQLMFFASMLVLFSAFFFGCNEEKFDTGIDLVPDSLRINTNADSTFTVIAYTDTIGALQTTNVSKILIGKYTDPILGEINASFVTQLIPASVSIEELIRYNATADSLVIYLRYPLSGLRVYGDSAIDCQIDVKRFKKYLPFSDAYYNNYEIGVQDTTFITRVNFNPKEIIENAEIEADNKLLKMLADTTNSDTIRPTPIHDLAITLPDEIRNEVFGLISSSINGGETFAEKVNGFLITPSASTGSISIFDYTDAETKAVLYYHNDSTGVLEYPLDLSNSTTRFNLFKHTYNSDVLDNLENSQDSVVYIHGAAGLRTKIFFPDIEELNKQGRFAVNKAELFLTVAKSPAEIDEKQYPAPASLVLREIKDDGGLGYLPDYINPKDYMCV